MVLVQGAGLGEELKIAAEIGKHSCSLRTWRFAKSCIISVTYLRLTKGVVKLTRGESCQQSLKAV